MAPSQDSSDHQDYETFLVGNPDLNLYLPLLLGRGHTQNIAGWKIQHEWRCNVFPIGKGKIPASHVCLLDGNWWDKLHHHQQKSMKVIIVKLKKKKKTAFRKQKSYKCTICRDFHEGFWCGSLLFKSKSTPRGLGSISSQPTQLPQRDRAL